MCCMFKLEKLYLLFLMRATLQYLLRNLIYLGLLNLNQSFLYVIFGFTIFILSAFQNLNLKNVDLKVIGIMFEIVTENFRRHRN